jgi:hypothetical protein
MRTLDSPPTALELRIQEAHASYFLDLQRDEELSWLMNLLMYLVATNLEQLDDFPRHRIQNDERIRVAFDVFKRCLATKHSLPQGWTDDLAEWEQVVVECLVQQVRKKIPEMYADIGEGIRNQLRLAACKYLQDMTDDETYRAKLKSYACASIRYSFERIPGNPIEIDYDDATGQLNGRNCQLASVKQILEFKSVPGMFRERKPTGRQRGSEKPAHSGRKPVDEQLCIEAWEAKQTTPKYNSNPWWMKFARKKNISIPNDAKGRDAVRKRMAEWAMKGRTLSLKKVGGLKPA